MSTQDRPPVSQLFKVLAWVFGLSTVTAVLFAVFTPRLIEYFETKQCLEKGGSYNIQTNRCDLN